MKETAAAPSMTRLPLADETATVPSPPPMPPRDCSLFCNLVDGEPAGNFVRPLLEPPGGGPGDPQGVSSLAARDRAEEEPYDWSLAIGFWPASSKRCISSSSTSNSNSNSTSTTTTTATATATTTHQQQRRRPQQQQHQHQYTVSIVAQGAPQCAARLPLLPWIASGSSSSGRRMPALSVNRAADWSGCDDDDVYTPTRTDPGAYAAAAWNPLPMPLAAAFCLRPSSTLTRAAAIARWLV